MKFDTKQIVSQELTRFRNLLYSDECPSEGHFSNLQKADLLRILSETPAMQVCGGKSFETLKMKHDGVRWVIELEAIVKKA